jgi:KDO2-lipid IV(A) lauroyltransferase
LYYLIGYRKSIVHSNLRNSFPDKSEAEIVKIKKEYYSHFCDLIIESVKAFTISDKQARKRFTTRNPELPDKYFDQGKNVAVVGGHYGNWELFAITVAQQIKHKPVALYTSITNKFFDRKMKSSRSKYGLTMLPLHRYREVGIDDYKNELTATIFGSDQSPRRSQKAYWIRFLNQETAVQFGLEKFARTHNFPVVYGDIHKIKRGYYEVEYHLVCEDPSALPEGEITKRHTRILENIINERPDYWLWSHKRWKLKKPADAELHLLFQDENIRV